MFRPTKQKNLKLLLAFSGAFLLSVTVFDLLPKVFEDDGHDIGLFIMLGILLQICLEFFSKGAEHGHLHLDKAKKVFPWMLFISLCVHALLEGFPVHGNEKLLYGIIVHKLPIALILTSFFINSKLPSWKAVIFLLLFAIMTPLGSFLSESVTWLTKYSQEIMAIVIGIFLHISTTILFESNEGHTFNFSKLAIIVTAIVMAYFI
jgi:zinc transporter ZupT